MTAGPVGVGAAGAGSGNVIRNLSIPTDIGPSGGDADEVSPSFGGQHHPQMGGAAMPLSNSLPQRGSGSLGRSAMADVAGDGVEVVIQGGPAAGGVPGAGPSQGSVPSLSPNWSSVPALSMPKRRGSREDLAIQGGSLPYQRSDGGSVQGGTGGSSTFSSSGRSSSSTRSGGTSSSNLIFGGVHINDLSIAELQTRKRELKQQLKQYDMNWAKQNGRMPCKAEKEPIRHLYESYNALKGRITLLEREGGGAQQGMHQLSGAHVPYRRSPAASQGTSSSGASTASDNSSVSGDEVTYPSLDSSSVPSKSSSKQKRKPSPTNSGGGYGEHHHTAAGAPSGSTPAGGNTAGTPSGTPSGAPPTDLAALKAEKQQLHQMLRSYEKDFYKLHSRQVSSFADIRPVASQYRRYKEIKKAIAALQQSGG
eukprot:CAMPEP_0113550712 /NCGR_PEP_ID=MMETSP0015_2-20120614/14130_1 /TAXON_ID=2838 /ORGANISM="Odontella" /LENGTH=421 /DNA_ID=CAMNT_0000451541 /DNA_START=1 /DNA_END=1266 /DNA_ORIENTATION=- /assembly_acc=CAM_ASM_000160